VLLESLYLTINKPLQAESLSSCQDIEAFGGLIYTGLDQGGKNKSAMWAGSENMKHLMENHHVDLRALLDDTTTLIK